MGEQAKMGRNVQGYVKRYTRRDRIWGYIRKMYGEGTGTEKHGKEATRGNINEVMEKNVRECMEEDVKGRLRKLGRKIYREGTGTEKTWQIVNERNINKEMMEKNAKEMY